MGRYRNPILAGCHPDPSICRVGETYYLATSTFEYLPGIPLHASTNLVDWELIGHAIDRPEQLDFSDLPSSGGLYAPTIRHHDGLFHVVCTVVGDSPRDRDPWLGRTGHFIVTAADPRGPWSQPIWLEGLDGIDPSLTFDDGRVWLCGTRLAEPGLWRQQTEVWLRELDPVTFQATGLETIIWHGALEGAIWAEGPHVMRHPDGGWMLLASEGGTFDEHALSVAYADEVTGPYRGDPANPRLTHRDLGSRTAIWGVGHADLVDAPDGRTWAVMLASHREDRHDGLLGRQTHLVPVEWEKGSPLFAPGVGRVQLEVVADGVPDQRPVPLDLDADFVGPELGPEWTGVRRTPSAFADLDARPGHVRLRAGGEPTERGDLGFLGRRLPGARVEVRVTLELAATGSLRGGILLRVSDAVHLEVSVSAAGSARLVRVDAGQASVIAEVACDPRGAVELALRIDGFDGDASAAGVSLGPVDLRPLSPAEAWSFVGAWIGPFAVGEGHVDVSALRIRGLDAASDLR